MMHLQVTKQDNKKKYLISPNDDSYEPIDLKKASSGVQTSSSLVAIPMYLANHFSFEEAVKRATFDFLFKSNRLDAFNSNLDLSKVKRYVHILKYSKYFTIKSTKSTFTSKIFTIFVYEQCTSTI